MMTFRSRINSLGIGFSLILSALIQLQICHAHIPSNPSSDVHIRASSEQSWKPELLKLHKNLIDIQSLSGDEKAVGDWLSDYLVEIGYEVEKQSMPDERGVNVRAWPKGVKANGGDFVLVTSHIDTVPPFIPYLFDEESQTISGRGSVDAKGCVAAQITAVQNILAAASSSEDTSHPIPPIHLLYVIEEETSGSGMRYFSVNPPKETTYSHAIFGEPTWGQLASGHKGLMMLRINTTGKAAHSGYPWLGLSAIDIIVDGITKIREAVDALEPSDRFGSTTVNFGQLSGGVAANVVAEQASAHVLFRLGQPNDFHPMSVDISNPTSEDSLASEAAVERMRSLVSSAVKSIQTKAEKHGGSLSLLWEHPAYGPVSLANDVAGFESVVVSYGTDVPNWTGPGSETGKRYLYGPGSIFVAHGPNESLKVDELVAAVDGYERLIRHSLAEIRGDKEKHRAEL